MALALSGVLSLAFTALAQTDRGTITGNVLDNTGAVVAGATVTATNIATNTASTVTTTSQGVYTIPALPAGNYKVRVEKPGFKAAEISPVNVVVGNTAPADFALEIGQVTETVEIAAASGAQVQTENAKITSQVSNKQIDELPLVVSGTMRSPFDLSLLTPEAKPVGLGGNAGTGGPGYGWLLRVLEAA